MTRATTPSPGTRASTAQDCAPRAPAAGPGSCSGCRARPASPRAALARLAVQGRVRAGVATHRAHTFSARYDRFEVEAHGWDDGAQSGHAWTAAYVFDAGAHWRITLEWLQVTSESYNRQDLLRPAGARHGDAGSARGALRARLGGVLSAPRRACAPQSDSQPNGSVSRGRLAVARQHLLQSLRARRQRLVGQAVERLRPGSR